MAEKIGEPLPRYTRGEESWPVFWQDFPEPPDDADLFTKVAATADETVLREAIHVWDNCLRCPGSAEGVMAGMIGALVRLCLGLNPYPVAFATFCDTLPESMKAMGVQAFKIAEARIDEEGDHDVH